MGSKGRKKGIYREHEIQSGDGSAFREVRGGDQKGEIARKK